MDINADGKLLDWAEQAALENIRAHIETASHIKRESNTALAIIIAGAGGALAYAANGLRSPIDFHIAFAAITLSLYLFTLCAILVIKCLRIGIFPSPTNEPKHLYQKKHTLEKLREVELENIQKRIEQAAQINDSRSVWINRLWVAATVSPVVFIVAFFLSYRVGYLF